jgi:small subunit ribosomal protein S16
MLVIRLQRTGRKGHAQFRIVVQDSRRTPTSGKVVANLGSYNPHTKVVTLDKEKAQTFLDNGAQPSNRAVLILKSEGIKLPKWVKLPATDGKRAVRNPDKRRSTAPAEPEAPEAPAAEADAEPETADAPADAPAEEVAEVAAAETEAPAEAESTDEKA